MDAVHIVQQINGRLLALEAMLTQLAWRWALTQPHPPSALAAWARPVEQGMARMAADPQNDPVAMREAVETVRGLLEELERTLHEQTLRQAGPTGRDH